MRMNLKLDASNRGVKMTSHPWPPVGEGVERTTPLSQEAIDCASVAKARVGAELWTKRMAFDSVPVSGRPLESQGPFRPAGPLQCVVIRHRRFAISQTNSRQRSIHSVVHSYRP